MYAEYINDCTDPNLRPIAVNRGMSGFYLLFQTALYN